MYNDELRDKFIALRAKRISADKIAALLGISRWTVLKWCQKYKTQIANLRAIHFENAIERAGADYEREIYLAAAQLNRIRAALAQRKVEHLSTEFLLNAEATAFARMDRLMRLADLPDADPDADASGDEEAPGVEKPTPETLGSVREQNASTNGANLETQNPTFYPPFIHQKEGGNTTDVLNHSPAEVGRPVPSAPQPDFTAPSLVPVRKDLDL